MDSGGEDDTEGGSSATSSSTLVGDGDERSSLWRETPNRVQSAGPVLRLSYLEIFDDSMYSINTNRKITPQNRYLHTFSSVNYNISRLSWIY